MRVWAAALLIVAAGLAAHIESLNAAFVFDDKGAILDNPTIRDPRPLSRVLSPPDAGLPVTGRPLTNLTFALDYALHGPSPRAFHAVNLTIHLLAALLLFGLVRRTLLQPRLHTRWSSHALPVATAAALLWTVHPLTTTTVAYVSQRAESLASLLILAALYAFARQAGSPHPRRWWVPVIAATWIGIGVKEITYAIPLLVLAYDRLILSTPWHELGRARAGLYALLFASWVPLAWLILGTGNRGGTWAGDAGYSMIEYARIQAQALAHYLRLVVWPHPLVFDYGRNIAVPSWTALLLPGLLILGLLAATVAACRRWPAAAFAGIVCWTVLAPSSSIVPIADPMFEHRMYLPCAAMVVLAITIAAARWPRAAVWSAACVAVLFAGLTYSRHGDYDSPLTLWQDTVEKRPGNARAQGNLGEILLDQGRYAEAITHFERAHALTPEQPLTPHNLAVALDMAGQREEAIVHYREALRLQPRNVLARTNLAAALLGTGHRDEALREYAETLAHAPEFAVARAGYGRALMQAGRTAEAIPELQRAAELDPDNPDRHFNLGEALVHARRLGEAAAAFRAALALRPEHVPTLTNLANTLLLSRQVDEAVETYRRALAMAPDATTHANLGLALLVQRKPDDARTHFKAALELEPGHAVARAHLDRLDARAPTPGAR